MRLGKLGSLLKNLLNSFCVRPSLRDGRIGTGNFGVFIEASSSALILLNRFKILSAIFLRAQVILQFFQFR